MSLKNYIEILFKCNIFLSLIVTFSVTLSHESSNIVPVNKNEKWKQPCLFVLRFYGPVNPMGSCWALSVYLTTRLLGRLSPVNFWQLHLILHQHGLIRNWFVVYFLFHYIHVCLSGRNLLWAQWRWWLGVLHLFQHYLTLVLLNKLRCHAHF